MRLMLALALVLGPLFFGLGIVLPLMRFETLYIFDTSPSLLEIIATLWSGGDPALAVVVGLVSVLFPVVKLMAISAEALGLARETGLVMRLLPHLSRWSLMDVVLVALVIVAAKTGGVAQAFSQPGLWFYAGSALTAALAHGLNGQSGHAPKP
ncbi:paraquat-inducible protein A [Hoeflea halophila]|uniref:Paraquat-inducible protein A n=1 Tax=Hoeflea halophila TaxID=714899 RepID=A0A286I868_9HYPH|nr:paraquat-inducible protein A [Hoeflea halophila]SOE16262.1 paraquat-inducible protein A [Hoeflea halophila]